MPCLIRRPNGVFYAVFSKDGKRVWRSLHTTDRAAASRAYLKCIDESTLASGVTLLRAQAEFLTFARTNFSQGTVDIYRNVFSQFNKFLSDRPVEHIAARDIDFYKSSRFETVSPATVNQELRSLRAFFNRLIVWNYLEKNPCTGIKEIKSYETTRPFLTKLELQSMLDYTKGTQIHDMILLATMTGLRKGEILNLLWSDVDLERRALVVRSSLSYRTKGGKIRVIPLNKRAMEMLQARSRESELVFPGDRGSAYNHDFLSRRFKKVIKACGLNPQLHFHSLRHTFASLLVQDGVPLYHVQRLLGHSSARVTEIYAHLGYTELGGAVERLDLLESHKG